MKFDLLTGGEEIKIAIFAMGFFQFYDIKVSLKQAPGRNYENAIFRTGKMPL